MLSAHGVSCRSAPEQVRESYSQYEIDISYLFHSVTREALAPSWRNVEGELDFSNRIFPQWIRDLGKDLLF